MFEVDRLHVLPFFGRFRTVKPTILHKYLQSMVESDLNDNPNFELYTERLKQFELFSITTLASNWLS